jgi:hypothetical protein
MFQIPQDAIYIRPQKLHQKVCRKAKFPLGKPRGHFFRFMELSATLGICPPPQKGEFAEKVKIFVDSTEEVL